MAWKKSDPNATKHNGACSMAFGRLSSFGCCPRCDELHNGAKARTEGWDQHKFKLQQEALELERIKAHFAPGGRGYELNKQGLDHTDTAFQW